jgi:PAS domain S-box-containing protein
LLATLCARTATTGPLVLADAGREAGLASLPAVAAGLVRGVLAVPLTAESGHRVGALCVFGSGPRDWEPEQVALLDQLADSVMAELELAALTGEFETSQTRWQLAMEAAGIGSFDLDLDSGALRWDGRLLELFGYDEKDFGGRMEDFNRRLHPDDLPRVLRAIDHAVASSGAYAAEYRIIRPQGDIRWVEARGRVLPAAEGGRGARLVGAAYDATTAHEDEARVSRILDTVSAAFFSLDADWRFNYVNPGAQRVLGAAREDLLGAVIWDVLPVEAREALHGALTRTAASGEPVTFEHFSPEPLQAWYEAHAWAGPDGLSVYLLDVTARRAAQEESERAASRAELLARVTSELAGTLDAGEVLGRLAPLVVPALAEWCVVSRVPSGATGRAAERLRDAASWHADPALRPLVQRYAELRLTSLRDDARLLQALETGRPVVLASNATQLGVAALEPGEARQLLTALAPSSCAVLPLRAHGRSLGLLTLFSSAGQRPAGADMTTALEVAARAGLSLDNARLYAEQRSLALGLQRSLLTDPPEPDHLQVVVRYEPAAKAAQVGGDWYDAFMQPGGATMLVIGDVVGHDTEAAAAMGQVRTLLRGIATTTDEGPAAVLSRLDLVMQLLQLDTTATAIVARLEQTEDERACGVRRMRWSNAGHPPPLVINPDGSVLLLGDRQWSGADLLLGIEPDTTRTESQVTLDPGATVLLYTDGLVERREEPLEEGIARLGRVVAELAEHGLDELCDGILARMLPAQADDDVAIAAVRLHRQDRPRPPEAGPERVPEVLEQAEE